MLFGASLEVAAEYTGRLSLVLIILVCVLWLTWWLIRGSYEFLVSRSARWMRKAIHWTRRHPVLGRITGPLLDPGKPELLSVSMLGLLLILLLWALALLLFLSPFSQQRTAFPAPARKFSVLVPAAFTFCLWGIWCSNRATCPGSLAFG